MFAFTSLLVPRIAKSYRRGPGNEATHPLDLVLVRDSHLTGRTLLRKLDEVSQLLHEIGHLSYEAGQKLVSKELLTAIMGCGRLGYKSRPSVGKCNKPLIFHPYNQLYSFNNIA